MKKRGAETRTQLIHTATELFGRFGFEGTSIRMLASDARCNLAAIPYHFGSKEGLYLAVATQIATHMQTHLEKSLIRVATHISAETTTRQSVFECMLQLLMKFGDSILDKSPSVARYVLREQLEPTEAFEILYQTVAGELHKTLTLCVSYLEGLEPEDPACIIRTHMLIGSFLGFISGRSVFLRRIKWEDTNHERRETLKKEIESFLRQLFHISEEF